VAWLGDCHQKTQGQGKGPAAALPAEAYWRFSFNSAVVDRIILVRYNQIQL